MNETESTFSGRGVTLYRRSVVPAEARATVCVVHGYGDHAGRHLPVMRWLAEHGVACHAVDLRGQGKASGRRGFVCRWDEYLDDIDTFLALPEVRSDRPTFLLAHSHGGLLAAAAGERGLPGVSGVVMTSPFLRNKMVVPRHKVWLAKLTNPVLPWLRVGSGLSDTWMTHDEAMRAESRDDALMTRTATPRWYVGMLRAQAETLARAGEFRLPLLLLFGGADPLADEAAARTFFQSAGSADKTMTVYPGLLHELLRETQRERVFGDILAWIRARARERAG